MREKREIVMPWSPPGKSTVIGVVDGNGGAAGLPDRATITGAATVLLSYLTLTVAFEVFATGVLYPSRVPVTRRVIFLPFCADASLIV